MPEPRPAGQVVRFAEFEVDRRADELRQHGLRIKLQHQPFLVLSRLLEQPGEVVSREELRQELWPADTFVDFEHGLNEAILKLRLALNDSADAPRFIETLPRRGYRFIAPVQGPAPAASVASPEALAAPGRPSARGRMVMALGALAGVVVLLTLARIGRREPPPAWGKAEYAGSLAVLPLANLSSDPDEQYFADGVTEELITNLAKIRGVRVIARTSVAPFQGKGQPVSEIARKLKVSAVVEGSVLRSGQKIRINVALIEAPTERRLWVKSYERELHDILTLQGELARAIAREIQVELTPQESVRLDRTRQVDPEAYQAYLKGRYHWNKRSEEGLEKGIAYFQQALDKDSTYASAYAGLADCYGLLGVYNFRPPTEVMPAAKAAATAALAIDEGIADPHASLGFTHFLYDWDWPAAESELRRALELNPGYAQAHQWYGVYLIAMARVAEGIAEIERAQELDPLSLSISENLGWARYCARQYDRAVEQFRKTLDLDPNYVHALRYLGLCYLQMGLPGEALAALSRARSVSRAESEIEADLALAYAIAGRTSEARRTLARLKKLSGEKYVSAYLIGSFYTGLAEKDQALRWLKKAHQERSANLVFLNADPLFDGLRSDNRFQELVRRIGLPHPAS